MSSEQSVHLSWDVKSLFLEIGSLIMLKRCNAITMGLPACFDKDVKQKENGKSKVISNSWFSGEAFLFFCKMFYLQKWCAKRIHSQFVVKWRVFMFPKT